MTCESCCREFTATRQSRDCPHCGFNNGRGSWPRSDDPLGVAAIKADDRRFRTQVRRRKRKPARAQEALAHA
jgi:hypothetical protein